jgi:hypothetical protein
MNYGTVITDIRRWRRSLVSVVESVAGLTFCSREHREHTGEAPRGANQITDAIIRLERLAAGSGKRRRAFSMDDRCSFR